MSERTDVVMMMIYMCVRGILDEMTVSRMKRSQDYLDVHWQGFGLCWVTGTEFSTGGRGRHLFWVPLGLNMNWHYDDFVWGP